MTPAPGRPAGGGAKGVRGGWGARHVRDVRGQPSDRGAVTIEAAIGITVLAVVLGLCLAGIGCAVAQVRCADAAREAARLAGRGDWSGAQAAVAAMAPTGAQVSFSESGDTVSATVTASPLGSLLPGVRLSATASAAREPDVDDP